MSSIKIFLRLLKYVRKYQFRLLIACLFSIAVAGLTATYAWLVQPVLDGIFIEKNQTLLLLLPVVIFGVAVLKGCLSYGQAYLMSYVGHRIIAEVRRQLFSQFLRLSLPFHHKNTSGRLVARVINDVNDMGSAIANIVKDLLQQSLTFCAMLGIAFYQNWQLASIVIMIFPFSIYAVVKIGKRLRKLATRGQESMGDMSSVLKESLVGIQIVKAYAGERTEEERFDKSNISFMRANIKAAQASALASPLLEVIGITGIAAIIWYGGFLVIDGHMKPGAFFSFLTALGMAFAPVRKLAGANASIQRSLAAAHRIFDMLDHKNEEAQDQGRFKLSGIVHSIEFRNVSFHYEENEKPALSKINLTIQAGEVIALVGRSGSGKSTFISLLPRFYLPTEGAILIDGNDIQQIKLSSVRSQLAIVSQDTILFDDTVQANIAYGHSSANRDMIVEAARSAYALEFIQELPKGLDTLIGENGVKLSGGQRQRLVIARAILRNPPLLILDEATSFLDNESEQIVQAALSQLMKNRTTVVIAHRLSTVQNANRIVVLNEGKIHEIGTHLELLRQNGLYKRLHHNQFYDMPVESMQN